MNCETAWELMSGHIDGENTEAEEAALLAHLSVCEDCRRMLSDLSGIETGVSSLQKTPPAELKTDVMARINAASSGKKKRFGLLGTGSALGAIAAVLALLIGTGVVQLPQRNAQKDVNAYGYSSDEVEAETSADSAVFDSSLYAVAGSANTEPAEGILNANPPYAYDGESFVESDAYDPYYGEPFENMRLLCKDAPLFSKEDTVFCEQLSQTYTVPVLAFYGFDADFPAQLSELSAELGALLEDAPVEEDEDGRLVIELCVDDAIAIHEWLSLMVKEEAPDVPSAEEETDLLPENEPMIRRIEAFDPDNSCLAAVLAKDGSVLPCSLPKQWSEHFAEWFRAEKNWCLFWPEEDFPLEHGDPLYLVLIPAQAESQDGNP